MSIGKAYQTMQLVEHFQQRIRASALVIIDME